ncbi:MAG TPA: 3-hydroxyacyl-CoA dehydrogenase NAD-binding domain-containing protein [Propylenella sp.]|nr:3-hydroxyacyl-CoA dehydrogenase NAD-binding domain-containing protein [Propylenella sp.]
MTAPAVQLLPREDVAVVLIDNPPVNALSHAVRSGVLEALARIGPDVTIRAAVIACAGKTFVAGADIREFGARPRSPTLWELIEALDRMTKPVVAALHGTVLGGGLELALGCHFRIAAPSTRLGFPEVKLGLLPGAGGTQRLPRAIGAVAALRMIVGGTPVSADEALGSGLIDAIARDELTGEAIDRARRLAASGRLRRLREETEKLAPDIADRSAFEEVAAELTKRARALRAPAACVDAVRAALDVPFEEALARERALFAELVAGEQSKAQRHLFFAEREAAKLSGAPPPAQLRTIARAAVIGAGTMGRGIAICFADAAIPVRLVETSEEALQAGLDAIASHYTDAAGRGRLASGEAESRLALVEGGVGLAEISADIVVEAVYEDMDLKRQIFAELDRLTRPEAILATNTSYLDVDAIAAATRRPARVAGMHFFSPANLMRLVEVVRGRQTAPATLAALVGLARRLGKIPVIVGNAHGFVGNRMLRRRSAAAERLLLEGVSPQEIDAAIVEFGFPMGPLAAADLAGLDIGWRMRKAEGLRAEIADALCERGRFGQKSGAGFYRYEAGSRAPLPDTVVVEIVGEAARRLGIEPRPAGREEIVERLLLPMVNEGARVLAEGVVARPGDIDVIWVHGYGWPVWRGGPMFWADSIGLSTICERLAAWAADLDDEALRPAPLLQKLASQDRGFASLRPQPALRAGSA